MYHTSLNKLLACHPGKEKWRKLLAGLHKTKPDDVSLHYGKILEISGIVDACGFLTAFDDLRAVVLFAADCAEEVAGIYESEFPGDKRVRYAIDATRSGIDIQTSSTDATCAVIAAIKAGARNAACAAKTAVFATDVSASWTGVPYPRKYIFNALVMMAQYAIEADDVSEYLVQRYLHYFCGQENSALPFD